VELMDNLEGHQEEHLDTRLVELLEVLLDNRLATMDNLKEDIHPMVGIRLEVGNLELNLGDRLVLAGNILVVLGLGIHHRYE